MLPRIIFRFSVISILALASGCGQMGYYLQAAKGQLEILNKRQSVTGLIKNPGTPEKLRERLALAESIRSYAIRQLGLDGNKGFTQYTDLKRKNVTWNIVAAPTFSIEPKTWCFPIAGCVAYKGFFDRDRAAIEQAQLTEQGYDVLLYGVTAYSTLGWFADPLLNTFIHYPSTDLAALIFHEFAHQIVYVQDDSEFNEAFATAVEYAVVERWLNSREDVQQIEALNTQRIRQNRITEIVLDYRDKLALAYQREDRRHSKKMLFAELKNRYQDIQKSGQGTRYYDWWFSRDINNADLLTVSTYYRLVPAFSKMLIQQDGNLLRFFSEVKLLAKQDKQQRDDYLKNL